MLHHTASAAFGSDIPELAARDRSDLTALAHDRFQSPRSRKRAAALLLLADGMDTAAVCRRTGTTPASQQEMLRRFSVHGLRAAIFGSPRRNDQRRYNRAAIVAALRDLLASRPPAGCLAWTLVALTESVQRTLSDAASISSETVREILKSEMGIKSVRHLDPYWLVQSRQR